MFYNILHCNYLAIAVSMLFAITACATQGEIDSVPQDKIISQILSMDFTDAVTQCEFETLDSDLSTVSPFAVSMLTYYQKALDKNLPDTQLTENDLRRLSVWTLPNRGAIIMQIALEPVMQHYRDYGEVPSSALDIFPELKDMSYLNGLDEMEILTRYARVIDPITGRFYASYNATEWQPASLLLEVIDDRGEIDELFPRLRLHGGIGEPEDALKKATEIWYVTIYGEEKGSIIFKDILFI